MWFPKAAAGAWAPVLVLAGALGALLGLRRNRWAPRGVVNPGLECGSGDADRAQPDLSGSVGRKPRGNPDWLAVCAGLFGAAMAARHTLRVTARHTAFEEAFGPDWPSRLSPNLRDRLLHRRYTPLLPRSPKVRCQRNLVYAHGPVSGEPQRADLWLPPEGVPGTGLGIVYLFGGAWHYMNKDMWTGHLLRYLAGQGHVVLNTSYRLAPEAGLWAMVADAKQAVTWLKAHGPEHGVDPARIVLMGCSSGAHLALLVAYSPDRAAADTSARAVVSDSGFTDLRSSYTHFQERFGGYLQGRLMPEGWFLAAMGWIFRRLSMLPPGGRMVVPRDMLPSLLGGTPEEVPEQYNCGSPLSHAASHCPPTLLIQGAHDYLGIKPDVQRLHQALRRAVGVRRIRRCGTQLLGG